jgi:N4-gp56 family major capsid protein
MAMQKRLPMHSGRTVRFRRYTNLATATVPLGPSGLTPPPQTLSALDIDATIDWYGHSSSRSKTFSEQREGLRDAA